MNERHFRLDVSSAWENIARDCGSSDGEGATDHLEQIFFTLLDIMEDDDLRERVNKFDPELKRIALDELKKYG
jgi:hypothetical protein